MNSDLLFDSIEEKTATERVLASFKVKSLNEEVDSLLADIYKYAKEIDDLLSLNNLGKRYLDRVSSLSDNITLSLDSDLENIDFRVKEELDDLIKRINTRIKLVHDYQNDVKITLDNYDLDNIDLEKEIKIAKLSEENFV